MNKVANTKTIAEIFLYMVLAVLGISIVFNPWVGGSNPLFYLAIMFMIFAFFSFVAYFIGRKDGDYELILLSLVNVVIAVFLYYFKDGNIPMLLSFSLSSWSFFYITLKLITAFQYRDINYKKHSIKMFITAIIFVLSIITVFSLFTDDIILGLSLYGYYYIIVAGLNFLEVTLNRIVFEKEDTNTFKLIPSALEPEDLHYIEPVKVLIEDGEDNRFDDTFVGEIIEVFESEETPKKKTTTKKSSTTKKKSTTKKPTTTKKASTSKVAKKVTTKKSNNAKKTTTKKATKKDEK